MIIQLESCYKLPWSETDNPNGWIEPTTHCNLNCPGCYRGADKPDHVPHHLPYNEVISQIDWLVQNRNIHTLSISGGEPIMYPQIVDVVGYAVAKNLRVMLYTNGLDLTPELLVQLQHAGVTQVLLHVDRYQVRADRPKGVSVVDLMQQFCCIFREVGRPLLGFILPLSSEYYMEDIQQVSSVAYSNADVVSLMVFTLYKEVCWGEHTRQSIPTNLTMQQVMEYLNLYDRFIPAAYLHSTRSENDPTWVFGSRLVAPERRLGYFSPALYRLSHQRYKHKTSKYMFISRSNLVSMQRLLKLIGYATVARAWMNYIASWAASGFGRVKPVYFQTILLLRGPERRGNEWDLCQGCPDRIIHNGRLVPSCILEDIKGNGNNSYPNVEYL